MRESNPKTGQDSKETRSCPHFRINTTAIALRGRFVRACGWLQTSATRRQRVLFSFLFTGFALVSSICSIAIARLLLRSIVGEELLVLLEAKDYHHPNLLLDLCLRYFRALVYFGMAFGLALLLLRIWLLLLERSLPKEQ